MSSLFFILIFISGVNGQEKVNINYNFSAKGKLKFKGFVLNKMQSYVCSILKIPNTITKSRQPILNFRAIPSFRPASRAFF